MKELLSEVQVGLQVKDAETPGTSCSRMPLPPGLKRAKGETALPEPEEVREVGTTTVRWIHAGT